LWQEKKKKRKKKKEEEEMIECVKRVRALSIETMERFQSMALTT
jgi:hypothetical protein